MVTRIRWPFLMTTHVTQRSLVLRDLRRLEVTGVGRPLRPKGSEFGVRWRFRGDPSYRPAP